MKRLEPSDYLEKLRLLSQMLRDAEKYGFEFSFESLGSSPVDVLLEVTTDALLLLRAFYGEGSQGRRASPGIAFLDRSDELGNPKSIKINIDRERFWDPEAPKFLMELASGFVKLKRGLPVRSAFMALFGSIPTVSVTTSGSKPKVVPLKKRTSAANFAYYRRRGKRRRAQNKS